MGNLGEAATKYIPDIANILKDEKVDSSIRGNSELYLPKFIRQLTKISDRV
ncbi:MULTISPECIES: hypothetical protein [unclassified Nostoc]|uniref:hypothetical protein n=1 Tax=unclassified Nostoc TaxID=2593658 RepID=UPI00167BD9F7|nr:hypothetical protein [Nostoc sp. 'Peltigera membranacea cyanobiont' 232]